MVELILRKEPGGQMLDGKMVPSITCLRYLRRALFPPMRNADLVARRLRIAENLEELDLSDSDASDVAMEHIGSLTQLKELQLSNTRITSDGVKSLYGHPSLEFLDLSRCSIDKKTIDVQVSMPKLELLFINRTRVSEMAVRELKVQRPGLEVLWESFDKR